MPPKKKFKKSKTKVPTSVGDIQVTLYDITIKGSFPKKKVIRYEIDVVNGENKVMETIYGELTQHLTDEQIVTIEQFMDEVRVEAGEIIP